MKRAERDRRGGVAEMKSDKRFIAEQAPKLWRARRPVHGYAGAESVRAKRTTDTLPRENREGPRTADVRARITGKWLRR